MNGGGFGITEPSEGTESTVLPVASAAEEGT
jgi:hypothetical protein